MADDQSDIDAADVADIEADRVSYTCRVTSNGLRADGQPREHVGAAFLVHGIALLIADGYSDAQLTQRVASLVAKVRELSSVENRGEVTRASYLDIIEHPRKNDLDLP